MFQLQELQVCLLWGAVGLSALAPSVFHQHHPRPSVTQWAGGCLVEKTWVATWIPTVFPVESWLLSVGAVFFFSYLHDCWRATVHLYPSSSIFTRQIRLTRSSVLARWGWHVANCPSSPWKACYCFWASAQVHLPFGHTTFLIALGPAENQQEQVQSAPALSGSVPNKSPAGALSRAPSLSSYPLCLERFRGDITTLELPLLLEELRKALLGALSLQWQRLLPTSCSRETCRASR